MVISSKNNTCVIGIDFGTLSARAGLYRVADGTLLSCHTHTYAHGIMQSDVLPGSALGCARDYLDALYDCVRSVVRESGVDVSSVIALGIDCTSCSPLLVDTSGQALSQSLCLKDEPLAQIRLWKDKSATVWSDLMNKRTAELGGDWLQFCGGRFLPGWLLPKLLQTYAEAPRLCELAAYYVETGDWLVWQLTGSLCRCSATAGFTGNLDESGNRPPAEFLGSLAPGFEHATERLLGGTYRQPGSPAGRLSEAAAKAAGLLPGVCIATAVMDSQAAAPSAGMGEGDLLMIMGTSSVYLINSRIKRAIPGIGAVVKNGIFPGYYGYSAGQDATGDLLDWYVNNAMPGYVEREASAAGLGIHKYLTRLAEQIPAGETGLLTLDWWNGNRCVFKDPYLSGCMVGLRLDTQPQHIYRALLEGIAFGAKMIVEQFKQSGITVNRLILDGGIPQKNSLAVQIFADVLNKDANVLHGFNQAALGAAITAAAAVGRCSGGYSTMADAAAHMGAKIGCVHTPSPVAVQKYSALFNLYSHLYNHFGMEYDGIMHHLIKIRKAGN